MFIPLHDDTPLRIIRFQIVTGLIIAANVAFFLYSHVLVGGKGEMALAVGLGTIPALITDHLTLVNEAQHVPEWATLVTYMFMHAGWMHLISNMAFMSVFADNVEDVLGHIGFAVFYLFCGVVAGLAHSFMLPESQAPLIGASGAVSGVMAAYLVFFPKARVWLLLFVRLPLRLPAYVALSAWFAFQFVSLLMSEQGNVIVAWWAHIGGFLAGLLVALLLRAIVMRRIAA